MNYIEIVNVVDSKDTNQGATWNASINIIAKIYIL